MKNALIFGIGAVVGGGIGAGTTILVLKRKLNKQKDEEIEEVRAYYKDKCKTCEHKKSEKEENIDNFKEVEDDSYNEKLSQKVGLAERNTADVGRKSVIPSNTDYTKFQKISENYTGKSAKELFTYPHEIDEDDFDGDDSYKKVILTYYESDVLLADVDDRPSEYNVEDFGYENFNSFGSDNIKYLRNEKSGTDFKIIYEKNLSYDEATGGVNLNDP